MNYTLNKLSIKLCYNQINIKNRHEIMNKYCQKCRTENLAIVNASEWNKSDPIEPTEIIIDFECRECENKYSQKIIFNSLSEYLSFLDGYKY